MALTAAQEQQLVDLLQYHAELLSLGSKEGDITSNIASPVKTILDLDPSANVALADLLLAYSDGDFKSITVQGIADKATVPLATTTAAGKVELATSAEAQAGTDTTRAVTPKALSDAVSTLVPTATDTVVGKVELATSVEAQAGTDTTRAVTPAGLKTKLDAEAVKLTGNQTIAGTKGFSASPTVPTLGNTDNSSKVANSEYVRNYVNYVFNSQQSLSNNGYQFLPGGMLIQWGTGVITPTSRQLAYPISFPTASLIVVATNAGSGANNSQSVAIATDLPGTGSNSVFNIYAQAAGGGYPSYTAILYIAIGY